MDTNKINCKECKRNNGFWAHVFKAMRDIETGDVGKFLMIISLIAAFIFGVIKLSSIISLIDTLLIACIALFLLGFILATFFW